MSVSIVLSIALLLLSLAGMADAAPADGAGRASAARVNINTASAEVLDELLAGIGPRKAAAIVAWRRQHGRFRSVSQLMEVKGIGPAFLERNRDRLAVQ